MDWMEVELRIVQVLTQQRKSANQQQKSGCKQYSHDVTILTKEFQPSNVCKITNFAPCATLPFSRSMTSFFGKNNCFTGLLSTRQRFI